MDLLKLLFWQHTGWAVQELPPTPMTYFRKVQESVSGRRFLIFFPCKILTERGEQVKPTGTLTPPRATPKRPKRVDTTGVLESWTLWQHWIGPVLHWPPSVGVGVATARRAIEETTASFVANIV